MNLQNNVARCHGHTPHGDPRPLAICRDCERYLQRTTAAKLTPWLKLDEPKQIGSDRMCVHRIPAAD